MLKTRESHAKKTANIPALHCPFLVHVHCPVNCANAKIVEQRYSGISNQFTKSKKIFKPALGWFKESSDDAVPGLNKLNY